MESLKDAVGVEYQKVDLSASNFEDVLKTFAENHGYKCSDQVNDALYALCKHAPANDH